MYRFFMITCSIIVLLLSCGVASTKEDSIRKKTELSDVLEESSGLIQTSKGLFTLNDNSKAEIYRINTTTGEILQTVEISDIEFEDKESISSDGEFLYIGDFGNNDGNRQDLKVVKIRLADITDEAEVQVPGERIEFHYPEQKTFKMKKKNNAFDSEAMVVVGDSLYVFTKQRNDHQTTLYALPTEAGTYAAEKRDVFNVNGRITAAALSPDNSTLLLLGYQDDHQHSFLWRFDQFTGTNFFSGNNSHTVISPEPKDWQTEGMTYFNANEIILSCETTEDEKASLYEGNVQEIFKN